MQNLNQQITRAKELLATVRHAAMATVNEDGSPHNTPFYYVIDDGYKHIYWASSPAALHSRNLARTSQTFVVLYEANKGGGLYLETHNAHALADGELLQGLSIWNTKHSTVNRLPMPVTSFKGENSQRLYSAEIVRYWVNYSEKDETGNVTNDHRQEINRNDLLTEV